MHYIEQEPEALKTIKDLKAILKLKLHKTIETTNWKLKYSLNAVQFAMA